MFCRVKSNNKVFKDDIVYRFYLSERYRENGKVKSKDVLICKIGYYDLIDDLTVNYIEKHLTTIKQSLLDKNMYSDKNVGLIWQKLEETRLIYWRKEQEQKRKQREKRDEEARKEWEEFNKKYGFNSDNFNNNCSGSNIGVINDTTKDFMIEIVKAGYKKLASKYHPDRGGKVEDMQKLNEAKEKLDKIVMK